MAERLWWGFLRTMAPDYNAAGYPLRLLTADWYPHLRRLVRQNGVPALFRTRREAREYGRDLRRMGLHGRAVRVRVEVTK